MSNMRTIQIDFDVHRAIENERHGFGETENAALRRLLNLGDSPVSEAKKANISANSGGSWFGKGVELPHGTEIRMEYNGQEFRGRIENGFWKVNDKTTTSPSDAAGSAALTKDGERPSLNGWIYWEIKRPFDSSWRRLKSLRKKQWRLETQAN